MGKGHGLTIEVYKVNPKTGAESEHTTWVVRGGGPLPPARIVPPCGCGHPECIARGGRP